MKFFNIISFICILAILSCATYLKYDSVTRVGNSNEAQIIVERQDDNTNIIMEVVVSYQYKKSWDGNNHWGRASQRLLTTAFFSASKGTYHISVTGKYRTGRRIQQEERRLISGREGTRSARYQYYTVLVDEIKEINSPSITFSIEKNGRQLSKRLFHVEYIQTQESIRITEANIDINNNNVNIDTVIKNSFDTLALGISENSNIAIINIATQNRAEGEYIMTELEVLFVNSRRYRLVARSSLDVIRAEQRFQLTSDVDDESAVNMGKFTGATVVIIGNISGTGSRKRLILRALDVETAEILAMSSASL